MNIKDVEGKVRMIELDHHGDDAGQWALWGEDQREKWFWSSFCGLI